MMRFALIFLVFLVAGPTVASAQQDLSGLLNRISRLERELADLQRSVYAGQPPAPADQTVPLTQPDGAGGSALARIEIRLQQIEAEIRRVTGRVEELGFQVQGVSDRMDRLQTDTDLRFRELTGAPLPGASGAAQSGAAPVAGGSSPTAGAPSDAAPVAGAPAGTLGTLSGNDIATLQASPPPVNSPAPAPGGSGPLLPAGATSEDSYKAAFDYLVKHDMEAAEAAFIEFLQAFPDDPLAGNAQYWLGETYYARERFEDAAVTFLEGYQSYPNNPKAADNLLKLGMSLRRIGRDEEACTTFAKLGQDFPNAPTNIKRRLVSEVNALGCTG